MTQEKSNLSLALLIFIAVFGITNIPNNYAAIGGQSITWFVILTLYFIPMGLIMAEMASVDVNTTSGISRWVEVGTTKKIAYLCGWAYFIENIFYLPMLASRVPVFLSWVLVDIDSLDNVVQSQGDVPGVLTSSNNPTLFLILAFITIVLVVIMVINFEKIFDKIGKYIGIISLVVAFGFIILSLMSIFVLNTTPAYELSYEHLKPTLEPHVISTLVWIIFAIAGIETIGSVINKVENPKVNIPKIVVIGAVVTIVAYVFGILGLSFIMTPDQLSVSALENAMPIMFAQLLSTYGLNGTVGILLFKTIMLAQILITIGASVIWYTATIAVLFADNRKGILPSFIEKRDEKGRPINGILLTLLLILIFLFMTNLSSFASIYYILYDMSTIVVIIPFLLLLVSYINFKRKGLKGRYEFISNKVLSLVVGSILLFVTLFAFVFGVIDLPAIVDHKYSEALEWFIISFGGLVFFMLIGWGLYRKK